MVDFKAHLIRFYKYAPESINQMAYNEDNSTLAIARESGNIELWSVEENWYQSQILFADENRSIEALCWYDNRLLSAGIDGYLYEYVLQFSSVRCKVSAHSGAIWCMQAMRDGSKIALGTEEGRVVLMQMTADGPEYERCLERQQGRIVSLCWSPDEDHIVGGGIDFIRVWRIESGQALHRISLPRSHRTRETVVWCLGVTPDFTIISGDSRGYTSFWNGKLGTMIKSFPSHRADVQALSVNKKGTYVMSSGIDPVLAQFELIPSSSSESGNVWVSGLPLHQHTHDVRAIVMVGGCVVSAGIDSSLLITSLETKKGIKISKKLPPIPQKKLIHTSCQAGLVLCQHPLHVELWRLAGAFESVTPEPVKLFHVNTRGRRLVVCSAVSDDGNFLAFSDSSQVRVFSTNQGKDPRLRKCPLPPRFGHASFLSFFKSKPSGRLAVALTNGALSIVGPLAREPTETRCHLPEQEQVLLLESDCELVAVACISRLVCVYTSKGFLLHKLPPVHRLVTALAWSPHEWDQQTLLLALTDHKLMEYDVSTGEQTQRSVAWSEEWPTKWCARLNKITSVSYHHVQKNLIVIQDDSFLTVFKTDQKFANKEMTISKLERTDQALHICRKFSYLIEMAVLADGSLVLVEVLPSLIEMTLPPGLKIKKFGV